LSYQTFGDDPKIDFKADVELHDNVIIRDGHWSPAEHPALSMNEEQYFSHGKIFTVPDEYVEIHAEDVKLGKTKINTLHAGEKLVNITEYGWCGNFRGFIQYRKFFARENRTDDRLAHNTNTNPDTII
jgi:hypothetical protein